MKRIPRSLRLLATVGEIRTATFQNREHIVVPTIALMEGVIWPINAEQPEFVPAEELAVAPAGWNGRPCMPDHPIDGAERVSANEPTILEAYAFGQVFNARYADKQLHLEGWLDPIRAAAVGKQAEDVIARVRAGQMVEVSVGVFVTAEETSGEHNGRAYKMVWRNIVPDHLAFLPEGIIGACSNDMGCGAPRSATVHRMASGGYELVQSSQRVKPVAIFDLKAIRERIAGAWTSRATAEGLSDADLRRMLNETMQPIEPGFMGVESVFPDDGTFVYACYLEGENGGFHTYERSYTMDGTNVKVSRERTEVTVVTEYKPLTAAAAAAAACGCGGNGQPTIASGGNENMEKKERVQKLLKKLGIKQTPTVAATYEALADDVLTQLEQQEVETPMPAAAPAAAPAPVAAAAAAPVPRTEAELLAEMPESMRRVFVRAAAAETVRKEFLVGKLKIAQKEYTEVQLQAMSVDELERMGRLLQLESPVTSGQMDFAPNVPLVAAAQADGVPAPQSLNSRIKAASSKTTSTAQ